MADGICGAPPEGVCRLEVVMNQSLIISVRGSVVKANRISVLEFLLEAHEFERGGSDLLIHHEHEGGRQDGLEQLRL